MRSFMLWLRWSWRDLRSNWVKVAAIALMIAIGTGSYAGLSSSTTWRRLSNDASFGALAMHDIRVELSTGSLAPQGQLDGIARTIDHAGWITAAEERLIVPIQVDASTPDQTVLVPGSLTGVDLANGPAVDAFHVVEGSIPEPGSRFPSVLVEHNFARYYELPPTGTLIISGGHELPYTGQVLTPEYFIVAPEGQLFFSEANYSALFTSLATAQELSGRAGSVNDLVLRLTDEADRAVAVDELEAAFDTAGIGVQVQTRDDATAYRLLTRDADNDARFFNVFALLILAGAVGAAFQLVNRLVEQQRREIGIAMSLGVARPLIAIRPMLVGAQIALLGVLFGIGVGLLIGSAMRSVLVELLPMPIWLTPFQVQVFTRAAVVGFLVPFVATIIPIRRAVRVRPVEALAPAHLTGRGGWLARRMRRVPLPGDTFAQLPIRHLSRAPRRTLLTILGIGAAITVLLSLLGIVDSIRSTVDRAEAELLGRAPDRVTVELDGFYPDDSAEIAAIAAAATVDHSEPVIRVAGRITSPDATIDAVVQLLDLDGGIWSPTITSGDVDGRPGVVLAEAAADDLGVSVGDDILLTHPLDTGTDTLALGQARLPVLATHPFPLRPVTFMDRTHAEVMGLAGSANQVFVTPAAGSSEGDLRRELFDLDAVAAVDPAGQATRQLEDSLDQILGILVVVSGGAVVLALLIAFNSASIALEARSRDHATMFAYGVPVRRALRMAVVENLIIGVLATAIGMAGGFAVIWWMLTSLLGDTMPDFAATLAIRPATLVTVAILGTVAVAAAPLFTVRRMRRMDLPGTLRLVE